MMNDEQEKLEAFKADLKQLLAKHDAVLGADVGEFSDTHGIYDRHLEVAFYPPERVGKVPGPEHRLVDAWEMSSQDID